VKTPNGEEVLLPTPQPNVEDMTLNEYIPNLVFCHCTNCMIVEESTVIDRNIKDKFGN
jgi:hypothetical protein